MKCSAGSLGDIAGWIGYALGWQAEAPEVHFGANAVQFTHNPFGGPSAITFGNVEIYGALQPREDSPESYLHTTEQHESQHTYQGQVLGPLYIPLAAYSLAAGVIFNGDSRGPASLLERGPQRDPPTPWW